jgi:hypothetical protein
MKMPIIFTTAPDVYDLPGTVPAGHAGFMPDGTVLRAVRVDVPGAILQVKRYLKAGYQAFGGKELRQVVREGGFLEGDIAPLVDLARRD